MYERGLVARNSSADPHSSAPAWSTTASAAAEAAITARTTAIAARAPAPPSSRRQASRPMPAIAAHAKAVRIIAFAGKRMAPSGGTRKVAIA